LYGSKGGIQDLGGKMALNFMRTTFIALSILGAAAAQADAHYQDDYLTISTLEVSRIKTDVFSVESEELLHFEKFSAPHNNIPGLPNEKGMLNVQNVGKVLSIGRDLVALGESIYNLIEKGKPSNRTEYAPISVIPRIGNGYADILETEGWKMPKKVTYQVLYKNTYGMEVVKFRYSILYSYGGTYNGKGAYLTAAQIIPESVTTAWGYDFTAKMKLGGIQNHGTREDAVAGAILMLEYTVETILQANLETSSYHITGRGGFRTL
jgi:hypothetical protein